MIIKAELEILDVFRRNLVRELTFNEIMTLSGKCSRNWVFNALKKFIGYDVLLRRKINNSYLYKANLNSSLLLAYFKTLDFSEVHINGNKGKNREIPYGLVLELLGRVKKITPFFIMMIFGSYASGKNKAGSDLDVAFIVEDADAGKKIKPYIENVVRKGMPKVDYSIIGKDELKEMLLREEENLGKEAYKNHLIIWGGDQFYELVKEAEKNGFMG